MYEYYVRHITRAGVVKAARLNALALTASSRMYGGSIAIDMNNSQYPFTNFDDLDVLQVFIRNRELGIFDSSSVNGLTSFGFVLFDEYFVRSWDVFDDENGVTRNTIRGSNKWHVFDWRSILWDEGVANRTLFEGVACEDIAKTLVQYNAGSLALVSEGRWRDGNLAGMINGMTVGSAGGRGNVIDRSTRGGKLSGVIKDLQGQSGGHFRLIRSDFITYVFDYSPVYQGEDKTANVIFSTNRRTMSNPSYTFDAQGSPTVAIGAGSRQDNARELSSEIRLLSYRSDYNIEQYYDLNNTPRADGLDLVVLARLGDETPSKKLQFDILQTGDTFYSPIPVQNRNTYNVGDGVTALYAGEQFTLQVEGVTLTAVPEGLDVKIDLSNLNEGEAQVI